MSQVLKIFVKIYKKKNASQELNQHIRDIMNGFKENQRMMELIQNLNLTQQEKQNIDQLFVA